MAFVHTSTSAGPFINFSYLVIVSFVIGWTTPFISLACIADWRLSLLSVSVSGTDHVGDYKYPFAIKLVQTSWLRNDAPFGRWKEGRLCL